MLKIKKLWQILIVLLIIITILIVPTKCTTTTASTTIEHLIKSDNKTEIHYEQSHQEQSHQEQQQQQQQQHNHQLNISRILTDLVEEPRARIIKHAILGIGGLHALAILFAIKLKIVIIVVIVGAAILYYFKFIAIKKSCSSQYPEIIHESPGISFEHGYPSGYSNHFGSDISSYNGPDPYSAYTADIQPDLTSFDHHHHSHHSDEISFDDPHSLSDISSFDSHHSSSSHELSHASDMMGMMGGGDGGDDGGGGGGGGDGRDVAGAAGASGSINGVGDSVGTIDATSLPLSLMQKPQRRYARQFNNDNNVNDNDVNDNNNNNNINTNNNLNYFKLNLGEIAFTFLGVDSYGCRKRFVCELDFRAKLNPLTRLAYTIIGRQFFDRYRNLSNDIEKPKQFTDCARIFNECSAAAAYDHINDKNEEHTDDDDDDDDDDDKEDDDDDDVKDEEDVADENNANEMYVNDDDVAAEVTESITNDLNEQRELLNDNNTSNREPLGRLILKRAQN